MSCNQCGRESCSGVHTCESCGKNAASPLMVDDKFYCDRYCLHASDPNHAFFSGSSSAEAKHLADTADILSRMRALKAEAEAAGVTWIS